VRLISARDVAPPTPRPWLLEPYVPAYEVTLMTGARRGGKGLLCAFISALASRGGSPPWDPSATPLTAHRVLWVTRQVGEDDVPEVFSRFRCAGGDESRLQVVQMAPRDGVDSLRALLLSTSPNVVVLDPLQAAIGDLADPRVRSRMEELVGLARETRSTILAIRHVTKKGTSGRGRGEVADVPRSELVVGKHPASPDLVVFAHAPSSYGEGEPQAFRVNHFADGLALGYVAEEWDDDIEPIDLLPSPPKRRERTRVSRRSVAEDFLSRVLADGPRPRPEILDLARRRRISERTVERAADALGVSRTPQRTEGSFAAAMWALPLAEPEQPRSPDWQTAGPPQPHETTDVPEAPPSATRTPAGVESPPFEPMTLPDPAIERFKRLEL
jgi:putative DNA primase/helicase